MRRRGGSARRSDRLERIQYLDFARLGALSRRASCSICAICTISSRPRGHGFTVIGVGRSSVPAERSVEIRVERRRRNRDGDRSRASRGRRTGQRAGARPVGRPRRARRNRLPRAADDRREPARDKIFVGHVTGFYNIFPQQLLRTSTGSWEVKTAFGFPNFEALLTLPYAVLIDALHALA